uniref:Uncharacterized protein n=1 Tax=Anguilla anguilla TaxID=7936 RepID=A0A0E9V2K8_ANGAN
MISASRHFKMYYSNSFANLGYKGGVVFQNRRQMCN